MFVVIILEHIILRIDLFSLSIERPCHMIENMKNDLGVNGVVND